MANEDDVLAICTELCQKLGVPLPHILIQEPQMPFFKAPTKYIKGKLEISPTSLGHLTESQLRMVLAYAFVMERRGSRLAKWMGVYSTVSAVAIAVPYIAAFEMKNPQWIPIFWIVLTVVISLLFVISFGWSFRAAFIADKDALKLTGDIIGVQAFIQSGGYHRKASTGEPMKPNETWTRRRLAALKA